MRRTFWRLEIGTLSIVFCLFDMYIGAKIEIKIYLFNMLKMSSKVII